MSLKPAGPFTSPITLSTVIAALPVVAVTVEPLTSTSSNVIAGIVTWPVVNAASV